MSNEELAAKYRQQFYKYLLNDYDVGSLDGKVHQRNKRDKRRDAIVIDAYTRAIKKLGLNPDTEQVLIEADHDNDAMVYRMQGLDTLTCFFYKDFKTITHVIENKNNYMGKKVDCTKFTTFSKLNNKEGTIQGIGKKSICIQDTNGNKEFYWYNHAPLMYNNSYNQGLELCRYLIDKYGE